MYIKNKKLDKACEPFELSIIKLEFISIDSSSHSDSV